MERSKGGRMGAIGWVLIVLAIGGAIGTVVALGVMGQPPPPGPNGGPPGPRPGPVEVAAYAVSVVDVSLLLALVVVYLRTFLDTRARFALGLVTVLVALTFQTVFGSSLLFRAFGLGAGSLVPFLLVSYLFETAALAVFLYLSLE